MGGVEGTTTVLFWKNFNVNRTAKSREVQEKGIGWEINTVLHNSRQNRK